MTGNDMDAAALLLDQTYFALDAESFTSFQGLAEISADILAIEKEAEGLLDGLLVAKAEA